MIHALKTLPEYFKAVQNETKTFEVRKDDRDFQDGDFLALNEFTDEGGFTGRSLVVQVTYTLRDEAYCKEDHIILGITPCKIINRSKFFLEGPGNNLVGGVHVNTRGGIQQQGYI